MSTGFVSSLPAAPCMTLSNGLRVANFSSPHPFNFVDGSWIPRCDPERVKALELCCYEETEARSMRTPGYKVHFTDIRISWTLTEPVMRALDDLEADNSVDIVLVPLPVMTAIKKMREDTQGPAAKRKLAEVNALMAATGFKEEEGIDDDEPLWSKVRVIRVADRETKTICIDRFCV